MCELLYQDRSATSSRFAPTKGILCTTLFHFPPREVLLFFDTADDRSVLYKLVGSTEIHIFEVWLADKKLFSKYVILYSSHAA